MRCKILVAVLALLAMMLAGCGRYAVRATEKQYLADPIMSFTGDPQQAEADEHIESNREGAAGGQGTSGGGCGCN